MDYEIRKIKDWDGYYVDTNGNVFSDKSGLLRSLALVPDSHGKYLLVHLMKNGVAHNLLVHRLVAVTFLSNPNNYTDVNHKDRNPRNNHVENLEFCSHKQNIHYSYQTLDQYRNCYSATLYQGDIKIGDFKSIKAAARYAHAQYNASLSMLTKYRRWGDLKIITKLLPDSQHKVSRSYRKGNISVYRDNELIVQGTSFPEVSYELYQKTDVYISCKQLQRYCNKKEYKGFRICR